LDIEIPPEQLVFVSFNDPLS